MKAVQKKLKENHSTLKAIQIIGQRKEFCKHKIPESSCARMENVDIQEQ